VIIITPRLVRPARPGEQLRTPLDDSKPANDPDFFLLGQSEVTEPMKNRLQGRVDGRPASIGHILDVRKGENHASN
jgi:pilus assembly protein CpaC